MTRHLLWLSLACLAACSDAEQPPLGPPSLSWDVPLPPYEGACEPGTFRAGEYCQACPEGTFSSGHDAPSCQPQVQCQVGHYVYRAGSERFEAVCAPCPEGTFSAGLNALQCQVWTDCAPGTFSPRPSAGSDRHCAPCAPGTFSESANATSCQAWTRCKPGSSVQAPGTSESDQNCMACPSGSSTQGSNWAQCLPPGACPAGTVAQGEACLACEVGVHCAGGSASAAPCVDGFDHDQDPATACVPWRECGPGFAATSEGSAQHDRTCTRCESGFYSYLTNAPECWPARGCEPLELEELPANTRSDTICRAIYNSFETLGSARSELASDVLMDKETGLIAIGGSIDANTEGSTWEPGRGFASFRVALGWDLSGFWPAEAPVSPVLALAWGGPWEVYAAGYRLDEVGEPEPFLSLFHKTGTFPEETLSPVWGKAWRPDGAGGAILDLVSLEDSDLIAVGQLAGDSKAAFIARLSPDGTPRWLQTVGQEAAFQTLSLASDGTLWAGGWVKGELPSTTDQGGQDLLWARFEPSTGEALSVGRLGSPQDEQVKDLGVAPEGGVYLAGWTEGALPGQAHRGARDAFVLHQNADLQLAWVEQFGTRADEEARALAHKGQGTETLIWVAGVTEDALFGAHAGERDLFVRSYQGPAYRRHEVQLGGAEREEAVALAFDASEQLVLLFNARGSTFNQYPDSSDMVLFTFAGLFAGLPYASEGESGYEDASGRW